VTSVLAAIRDFLREPRPRLTDREPLDIRIAAAVMVVILVTSYLDESVPNPLMGFLIAAATTYAMRWFRTHAIWLALGVSAVYIALWEWDSLLSLFGFYFSVCLAVVVFALARWGSGRDAFLGSAAVLAANTWPNIDTNLPLPSLLVWSVWSLYPLGFGLAARSNARERHNTIAAARLNERHEIARELHDSVAHHVSAITIQAQAARTILATKPDTARSVLETIEEEAARTLDEMRRMVTVLRDNDEQAELRPQAGLQEIAELAIARGTGPKVDVSLEGRLDHLDQSVQASLFRIAQEGVTNARRHARSATRIHVEVVGHDDRVDMTITDNGESLRNAPKPGFGLTGLGERAAQHGGTLTASPQVRGWVIEASIPLVLTS